MANYLPVAVGSDLSRLVIANFDNSLREANIYSRTGGWNAEVRALGLHFDLSQVEWVELDALVSMLLLIEKAKLDNIRTSITMPRAADASASEHARHRRSAVIQYLEYLRFRQAAQITHVSGPEVMFLDALTAHSAEHVASDPQRAPREPLYRYIFPLVWLSSRDRTHVQSLASFLRSVVGDPARGLRPLDAAAIANVLLFELIDNADRHSKSTGFALVAARGRTPDDLPRTTDTYPIDRDYLGWLRRSERPFIEIVVGDSGKGIHATLRSAFERTLESNQLTTRSDWSDDANILAWSLDRWSSSDTFDAKRGTRGLYRVDRVVTKYEGLLSLRSGSNVVSVDHGGPAHDQILCTDDLAFTPGSTIRLWVPAFREVPAPRDTAILPTNVRFHFVRLGPLTPAGISTDARQRMARALRVKGQQPVCIVAVFDGGVETRDAIESALAQAAETRHPGALILFGLPGGWDLITGAVESVNLEHDRTRRADEHAATNHFEIWDPVLIIGRSDSERLWVGATEGVRVTLAALLDTPRLLAKQFQILIPDPTSRGEVRRILRNDTALVLLHGNGDIKLRVGPNELSTHVRAILHRHIESHRDGVRPGPFITPSLTQVDIWLDVPRILDSVCTPAVAMFLLAAQLRLLRSFVRPAVILIDSAVSPRHAELLARYLDAERVEVMLGELTMRNAEGLRTLEPGSSVVVYTNVISSGESASRCIAQVLRDTAQLIGVVCLIDARKSPTDEFDFHGHNIPLVSLTRAQLVSSRRRQARRNQHPFYISPVTYEREHADPRQAPTVYDLGSDAINRILLDADALHFRHIANRSLNRHFTLYADPARAVADARVAASVVKSIKAWQQEKGVQPKRARFELWHASDHGGASAVSNLAARVAEDTRPIFLRPIQRLSAFGRWSFSIGDAAILRAKAIVVVDWGAVTGNTIVGLLNLAAAQGAQHVLMVVFQSQLPAVDESFFARLRALSPPVLQRGQQLSLLLSPEATKPRHGKSNTARRSPTVDTRVKFISRFEVEAYAPGACPACKHLGRMATETYPTTFLANYATSFKTRRLRRWHRHEVSSGLADSIGAPRLDGKMILRIAWFRELLQEALASTRKRHEVWTWLLATAEELESNAVSTDVGACLHFLSMESQWLARPPLHFPQLQAVLARICHGAIAQPAAEIDTVVSALVVYRTGAKDHFAKAFGDLFSRVQHRPDALGQLLYSAFTFISRPYVQTPGTLRPLMETLRHIEREQSVSSSDNDLGPTLRALTARADFEYARGLHDQDTPLIAWRRLRAAFDAEHDKPHPATVMGITDMLPGSDAAAIEAAVQNFEAGRGISLDPDIVDWIRNLEVAWVPCRRFLDRTLLPLLGKLSDVMSGDDFESYLGPETAARLREYVRAKVPNAESAFGQLLRELGREPERLLERRNWLLFRGEVLWYYEHIFRSADLVGTTTGIVEFLRSAPSSLAERVSDAARAAGVEFGSKIIVERSASIPDRGLNVFCPDTLLRELLKHLLKNAGQSHRDQSRIPGVRFSAKEQRDRILLTVGSWHTRVTDDFGASDRIGGLSELRRRLAAFGGSIELDARPHDTRFSFVTRIEFIA